MQYVQAPNQLFDSGPFPSSSEAHARASGSEMSLSHVWAQLVSDLRAGRITAPTEIHSKGGWRPLGGLGMYSRMY